MTRWIAYSLLGVAAIVVAIVAASGWFDALPKQVSVACAWVATLAVCGAVLGFFRRRLRDRATMKAIAESPVGSSLAARLLGDFPPYVIEAAELLGATGDTAAVPLLISAVERLIADRPAGWPEMAGAMATALARIGDARALPVLLRLRAVPGSDEIGGLEAATASLRDAAGLLRPAEPPSDQSILLRPATAGNDKNVLLRPSAQARDERA